MNLAWQAGRLDVDTLLDELGVEQITEWEAYFSVLGRESDSTLPVDIQSQDEIANKLLKLKH